MFLNELSWFKVRLLRGTFDAVDAPFSMIDVQELLLEAARAEVRLHRTMGATLGADSSSAQVVISCHFLAEAASVWEGGLNLKLGSKLGSIKSDQLQPALLATFVITSLV